MGWFALGTQQDKKIRASTSVGITEQGKREVSRFSSRGDSFTILAVLEDRSPQTISQVADEANMPINEVTQKLKILQRQGYVRFIGMEG